MLRPTFFLILLMALGPSAPPAFGWGALGHQVVADLAQDMLTAKARDQAASLLGPPSGGGAGGAGFRLSSVSVWADDIKSLRPETRPWHYVTLQLADPGYRPGATDSPNVVTALNASLATLANASADRYAREEALKWAVHLVGDLHQPLHVGEDHDKGGNLAKVKVGRRTHNLHAVWDYVLLERLNLPSDSLRALLARSLAADPAFIARHARGSVESWVDETHAKTRSCYLLHGKPMRKGIAVSLDRTYTRPNTWVILEQIKIAAVRLAWALNRALDPAAPPVPRAPALARPAAEALRADSASLFRGAEDEDGKSGSPEKEAGPGRKGGKFAWSGNSKVYHFAECADVARIKRKNLRRGDEPPPGMALHAGCPRRD